MLLLLMVIKGNMTMYKSNNKTVNIFSIILSIFMSSPPYKERVKCLLLISYFQAFTKILAAAINYTFYCKYSNIYKKS